MSVIEIKYIIIRKKKYVMIAIMFLIWIILNAKVTWEIVIFGIVIAAAIYMFSCKFLDHSLKKEIVIYKLAPYIVAYFFVLLFEIIKANLLVIRLIILDKYQLEPEIIHFECDLKDETCRVILASSITLTPGTITLDVYNNMYTVHCLDKDMAEGMDDSIFIKLLKKMDKMKIDTKEEK